MSDSAGIRLKFRGGIRHAALRLDQPLVEVAESVTTTNLPLVLKPVIEGVNLFHWIQANKRRITEDLDRYGAILFRGFHLQRDSDLTRFTEALSLEPMHYVEGATPRTQLRDHVYTSTEFPAGHTIAQHNELSYVCTWPMKICFLCITPAKTGGETPISDVRKVLCRIPAGIRELFIRRKWMLVRNYIRGLGLTWQQAFRTSSQADVEEYCRNNYLDYEWQSQERLQTRQVRPAVSVHPRTGESVWFNHVAFWHNSSLPGEAREVMLADYGEYRLPYDTLYGDNERIDRNIIAEIQGAWDAETVKFSWEKGDVLLLDNMLVAHGRSSFTGDRKVVVSMGEPFTRTEF